MILKFLIYIILIFIFSPFVEFNPFIKQILLFSLSLFLFIRKPKGICRKNDFIIFIFIFILCLIQTSIFFFLNFTDRVFFSRGFSSVIYQINYIFFCYSLLNTYGKSAVNILFKSLCFSYLINIIIAIYAINFKAVLLSVFHIFISGLLTGESFATDIYLEKSHATLLIMPLFFIFYLFDYKKVGNGNSKYKMIFSLIFSLMAFKRIAILAAIVIFLFFLFKKITFKKKILFSIGFLFIVFIYVYIYSIKYNILFDLASENDINMMSRDIIYKNINYLYDFNINFWGNGWGFAIKFLHSNAEYLLGFFIGGLHNDLLKVFIDLGFVLSVLYYSFFLIIIPRYFYKTNRPLIGYIFFSTQLYLFIIYMTDNAMTYIPCQMAAYLLCYYYENHKTIKLHET